MAGWWRFWDVRRAAVARAGLGLLLQGAAAQNGRRKEDRQDRKAGGAGWGCPCTVPGAATSRPGVCRGRRNEWAGKAFQSRSPGHSGLDPFEEEEGRGGAGAGPGCGAHLHLERAVRPLAPVPNRMSPRGPLPLPSRAQCSRSLRRRRNRLRPRPGCSGPGLAERCAQGARR